MNQQKTDFRITVLNVTLDDLNLIDEPFFLILHQRSNVLSEPTLT